MINLTEKQIQNSILEWLGWNKIFAWRNNSGALQTSYKGKQRFFRYGLAGSADILGILPNGQFLAIEVKKKGNKPTALQQKFLAKIRLNKGKAFVAYSIDDVKANI